MQNKKTPPKKPFLFRGAVPVLCLAALCAGLALWVVFSGRAPGTRVVIRSENRVVYTGSLYHNYVYDDGHNRVVIRNGRAEMEWADCKNQICVRHPSVSKKNQQIICMPHRMTVEIH